VLYHGQSNTYSFKLNGKRLTLTPLTPNQIPKPKTGRERLRESTLFVNTGRLKRVISKGKPIFVILKVESNPNIDPKSFHPLVHPLPQDFEDAFPQDLPPGLSPKRGDRT